jgi:diguanylate cyclase (GGDEF)-like protein
MLKRGWWIILLVALIAMSASLGISYLAVPKYQATARFIITPGTSITEGRDVINSLDTLDRRSVVATYAEVMNSERILNKSAEFMQVSPAQLVDYTFQAVVLPDANVLELTVTGPSPSAAAELANAIGFQTILFTSGLNMSYDINVLDSATAPLVPFSPQPARDAGIALVLGAVLGAALAIVSEQVRIPLETYRHRLRIDSTTGVYNNRYFRQILEDELTKDPDGVLSIGLIELTGLQDLRETLPLSGLQYLLKKVTGILRQELRGNDIIGRWNDTSFAVLLPTTPGAAAKRTLDRIYHALSESVTLSAFDATVELEPLIGGALYSSNISAQELIDKAENSIEQARASSDSSVRVWEMNNPFWVQKDV